jgi:hypothetical protein
MFNEFKKAILANYNKSKEKPVNEFDPLFKAYLIGAMSVMISDNAYKSYIRNHKKENN